MQIASRKIWQIYLVTCIVTGKQYIGLTARTLEQRWYEHFKNARNGRKAARLQKAILKHGRDAFTIEAIYFGFDEVSAILAERELIESYETFLGDGYNSSSGGETQPGFTGQKRACSEKHKEHLRRQAAAMKGKKRKPESIEKGKRTRAAHGPYIISDEQRKKMSESRKGKVANWSEEGKARILAAAKSPKPKLGEITRKRLLADAQNPESILRKVCIPKLNAAFAKICADPIAHAEWRRKISEGRKRHFAEKKAAAA